MDDVRDVRWKEFDGLGEEEVRKRVAASIWGEEKTALAHQWLEHRQWNTSSADAREGLALAKDANDLARRGNTIATFALIGAALAVVVSILGLFLKDDRQRATAQRRAIHVAAAVYIGM